MLIAIAMLLSGSALITFAGYCCVGLLKSAQAREDADDQRLWDYLLNPRTL
jgi:hypothetical protein